MSGRILSVAALIGVWCSCTSSAVAETPQWEYQGQSGISEPLYLDVSSIRYNADWNEYHFTYKDGPYRVLAFTRCDGYFEMFEKDGVTRQGGQLGLEPVAFEKMLALVCQEKYRYARVIGPVNFKQVPGEVLDPVTREPICTTDSGYPMNFPINGFWGDWAYTNYCGATGMVHTCQLVFSEQ